MPNDSTVLGGCHVQVAVNEGLLGSYKGFFGGYRVYI